MNCLENIDTIMTVGRVIVLWLSLISGTVCIYFGWSLYKNTILSKTSGELTYGAVKLAIAANGPGVFIALFGAYIVATVVNQKLELSQSTSHEQVSRPPSQPDIRLNSYQNWTTPETILIGTNESKPKCLVTLTRKSLLLGDEEITSDDLHSAIDASLKALEKTGTNRKHIYVLRTIKTGVINESTY